MYNLYIDTIRTRLIASTNEQIAHSNQIFRHSSLGTVLYTLLTMFSCSHIAKTWVHRLHILLILMNIYECASQF